MVTLLFSIAAITLSADLSPIRSNAAIWLLCRRYKSSTCLIKPAAKNCSTNLSPKPSIFMARREAKCLMASLTWAGQYKPPVQRATASPTPRSTSEPHTGHCAGKLIGLASVGRRSVTTRATSGITSPARRIITKSPMRISLRSISSILCKVALLTVTPPTNTGLSLATGVNAPVRPTWNSTSTSSVISSCAGNLCAIAQRGARLTKPSDCCRAKELTL